jgi:hypothetical protein
MGWRGSTLNVLHLGGLARSNFPAALFVPISIVARRHRVILRHFAVALASGVGWALMCFVLVRVFVRLFIRREEIRPLPCKRRR